MAITKDIQLFQAQENEAKKVTLKDHVAYRNRQPETVAKDFNTYTETGFYTWSITANILQDCANRPCDEFGILEVKNDNTAIIYQRYEANNNVVYIRTFYNEAWTEWDIEVNKDYVDGRITLDNNSEEKSIGLVFKVTDTQGAIGDETISVSPNMGIKVVD